MTTIRARYRLTRVCGWPLERLLFALAGTVIISSVSLSLLVSPWFSALTLAVGVNQWLYAAAGTCPASFVLLRAPRVRSALYDVSDGLDKVAVPCSPRPPHATVDP